VRDEWIRSVDQAPYTTVLEWKHFTVCFHEFISILAEPTVPHLVGVHPYDRYIKIELINYKNYKKIKWRL
jgi:hypothetical protein